MRLLDGFLRRMIHTGALEITDARGRTYSYGPGAAQSPVRVRFTDEATPRRIAFDPPLAAAEAYMDGRMQVHEDDIEPLLALISRNAGIYDDAVTPSWQAQSLAARWDQLNYRRRARRNVAHHYDLSSRLYDLFLDNDMQYSCAYYRAGVEDLETAQTDKKAHIAAKLALEPGQHVLDIGCGWGGMALYLNRVADVEVTGITLSQEQLKTARERAEKAGVADRVRFEALDYRDISGSFDRIVSVGMFEHVGKPHYRGFFERIKSLLADDGVALLHTIGRMDGPGATDSFTAKYIFPGGYSPALSEIVPAIERARLWITDIETLRLHYAKTLDAWLRRTRFARAEIEALYDERFYRMWTFYLAASKHAFLHGGHVNFQIQLARSRHTLPLTREYMMETETRYRKLS